MYSGSQWIHKNAYGKLDTIKSRRPHCRKRWEFITASQFGHKFIPVPQANKEWEKLEKIMAWNQTKVKSKKMVIDKARTADSSFRIINGHLSSEKCWIGGKTPKIQRSSCNSEVILWKTTLDLMQYSLSKDLQPSQMTAAKIMDIISRLPGCDGQAADAVSAHTQVKMEDAHKLLKISKSECPDIWIRLRGDKWPESWSNMEDPFWQDYHGKSNLRKSYWNMAGRKFQIGDVSLFIVKKDYTFLSVYVDDVKLAGKKHNLDPMWKALNKEVDLGEPTSFLDHVYLGCTQRQCEVSQRNCG